MNLDIYTLEKMRKQREEELKALYHYDDLKMKNNKKILCCLPWFNRLDYCQCT
ncbi:hypothetical protein [Cytobacillus purgationiresistens]|uniref:Uncharacterized protein n=1 Tax=Cytobacillus purgationiresistens TaxID=863449 RepID=A0ABU0AAY2_9BACI|nr:hypothetical protein [Cytobacillus purgationiresistens]MDQ0268405.1 hypothetical protein [Cytobacillus purgationiresistens]